MNIGVFGGSFNPVHRGHIALAEQMIRSGIVDSVWMVLSPQNPLKKAEDLAADNERLKMLKLACRGRKGLHACDIELSMPRPSYTYTTLCELSQRYPQHRFRLIIGADNMLVFDRWFRYKEILEKYPPVVYPRPGYEHPDVENLPLFDVSSTGIRQLIAAGSSVAHLLPPAVAKYIRQNGLYKS